METKTERQKLNRIKAELVETGHTGKCLAQQGSVIALNEERVVSNGFYDFDNGLMTISIKRQSPSYQLIRKKSYNYHCRQKYTQFCKNE